MLSDFTVPTPEVFEAFFDLSLTGSVLYNPVRNATGAVADLAFAYLNPAAQRLLGLPARPDKTYLQQFPGSVEAGIWAFHHQAFVAGEPCELRQHYQADGYDSHYLVAARRVGEQLLVSFSDAGGQPRAAVEQTLRASHTREQAARAEAETQRQRLHAALMKMPANIALLRGPEHVFDLVNPEYEQLFSGRALRGRPLREAIPELVGQGFYELFDQVYQAGQPYYQEEMEAWADFSNTGGLERRYYRTSFQPIRNAQGEVAEVLNFSVDITAQVEARRQVEQLNQELETRVQERTQETQAARAEAERQRRRWEDLFWRAPAAICIFNGPEWVYEFVNPHYQALFPGRELLGKPLLEALPEVAGSPLEAVLHHVYDTGEPYTAREVLVPLARTTGGPVEDIYFDLTYLARYNDAGQIDGFITYANDVTEQVRARQAREAQQDELQRIFEQAPVGIAVFRGASHTIELANDMQLAIWDRAREQALGKGLFELLPEVANQGFEERLAGVLTTGVPYVGLDIPASFTRQGVHEQIFVSFVYAPLREPDGRISGVVVVVSDTSEQVRARQQVEQLNQELEARVQERTRETQAAHSETERQRGELERLFELAPVAITVLRGPRYVVELANATILHLWGRTQAQVLGRGLLEAMPELVGQGFEALLDGVRTTGEPYVAYARPAQHERGGRLETVYWDFAYVPIYDSEGCPNGVLVVATDVTAQVEARRKMEQLNQELELRVQERTRQLSEQQALLSQILGQLPAAIATLGGPEHRYTFFNEQHQLQMGHRAALGQPAAETLPGGGPQGYVDLLDQVYVTGQRYEGREIPFQLHTAGANSQPVHYFNFVYQPLADEPGHITGILLFAIEVTEQVLARQLVEESRLQVYVLNEELAVINEELRATNEELHHSNARLTRTNNDLDTFVYTASHDLKAPITNIESILHALRATLPPEVQQDATIAHILGLLGHTVGRFRATIDQLTDLARLQQTYNEPAKLLLLAPIVSDVLADLAPITAAAAAEVYVAVPPNLYVSFIPAGLRSVVYNLLSNAIKYRSPERPAEVWLRAEQQLGAVVLSVQDNGLGLSKSQQQRLFGVFQRLHTHVEGTGVGLYMIKRLIENAGATISVTSSPGVGSTFTVTFPAPKLLA